MDDKATLVEAPVIDSLDAGDRADVPKNYVPEGFDDVEAYLKDMREDYEQDLLADEDNRKQAMDDKEFTAGKHWDPAVQELRRGLPCLTINSIPQFTAQVVGDWRSNRNSIKVVPSENGDVDVADVREDLVRAIEMKSRADRVYDNAFESTIQCGDGDFRVAVEYARENVFDQEIYIRPIEDALSVVWDRLSMDPTGRDARHCFVDDTVPLKYFKKNWPEADPSTLNRSDYRVMSSNGWVDSDTAKVTEHWRMIERKKLLGLFSDGSVHDISAESMDKLVEKHGYPTKTRLSPCLYAQMHLVTGWKILAGPYEYKLNRLPIIRVSGRVVNLGGKRVRYGLVRFMKDPVRLRNFWRSVAAEQLGYAPKAQWLAPASAVEGREDDFRKAHLSRDPLLIFNDDATVEPQRIEPPAIQAALLNEAAVNTQDMKDVTGIHDASLGIKSNETSGKAIMARQREGDIANLVYHDNGNAAILEAGDVINQLIPQIYDGTRILRTIGKDESVKFVRVNDPYDPNSIDLSVGMYDVAIDTGASYTTRRVEAAQAMMDAIQVFPEMMQIAGDLVVKAQDWPGAQELAERLRKTIPPQLLDGEDGQPQQPQVDPAQLQQLQAQMQALSQENEQLKSGEALKAQEVRIKAYDAETKRIAAIAQAKNNLGELTRKTVEMAMPDPDIYSGGSDEGETSDNEG